MPLFVRPFRPALQLHACRSATRRHLLTLAIETSCDDTCVAILEKHNGALDRPLLQVHHHEKVTSNNLQHGGIHPIVALDSHQQHLARAVRRATAKLPATKPDFVSVTRGPGMRSSLNAGLDLAKGLAVAWDVPLLAVNHMQAHALTPRLVSAMRGAAPAPAPAFPFLSLLVSGGHTMLLHSRSLNDHPTLAATIDVAVGDAIDKLARAVLPPAVLGAARSTMYGPALESFAFPAGEADYAYAPPATRAAELARYQSPFGWSVAPPLSTAGRDRDLHISLCGVYTAVSAIVAQRQSDMPTAERRHLAATAMRLMFEHLATRTVAALNHIYTSSQGSGPKPRALVVSGGVAANKFLRHLLRAYLDARGYEHVELVFPPVELCTDNAVMIGWAGLELYEAGLRSSLACRSLRKWSLDASADDGGILGVGGWLDDGTGKTGSAAAAV